VSCLKKNIKIHIKTVQHAGTNKVLTRAATPPPY